MKKFLSTLWLLILFQYVSGQNDTIRGTVTDESGYTIEHAKITQDESHYTYSGLYGTFTLPLNPEYAKSIEITHPLYDTKIINRLDTLSGNLKISLKTARPRHTKLAFREEEVDSIDRQGWESVQISEKFAAEFFSVRFDAFENYLGTNNIDILNKKISFAYSEIGLSKSSIYYAIHYGYGSSENNDLDSIAVEASIHHYGFLWGKIKDFKYFQIAPEFGLDLNRWRLQNFDKNKLVTMQQYLQHKELDLRFNQFNAFAGLNLTIKFSQTEHGFMGINFYARYVLPISKPIIYTAQSRIINDNRLSFYPFSFGFGLTLTDF